MDVDVVLVDHELGGTQQRNLEKALRLQGRRPHAAHPRHLRPPRANPRRPAAGRTRPVELPAAPAHRPRRRHVAAWAAASARAGLAKPSSKPTGGAFTAAHQEDRAGSGRRARLARRAAPPAPGRPAHDPRPGRLHQRRQVDPLQPPHRRRRPRRRPDVRHARSHRPADHAPVPPQGPAQRHRRLHPQPAHHAGRGLPRHARRGHRGHVCSCTSWTLPRPPPPSTALMSVVS